MLSKSFFVMAGAMALTAVHSTGAEARDQIRIVGSSTVFPFSTAVAEEFGRSTHFKTPIVESTGTGGGFKLFCAGASVNDPDISNASREIKKSEIDKCAQNGVKKIVEIKVGYDGIVLAYSKKGAHADFTVRQIYLGLAKDVEIKGQMVANPYKTWKDVDPSLPDEKIEVMGPPPTSGTRDAFVELVMDAGCKTFPKIAALEKSDKDKFKATCQAIREDGAYVEAGENDNLIVQKLVANPKSFGIFGYSYLEQNTGTIQGAKVGGKEPSFDNIASGAYPVSRPLFIYAKADRVSLFGGIPGIKEYLAEYTSEKAWGDYGYLVKKGLIPMPKAERVKYQDIARKLTPMK